MRMPTRKQVAYLGLSAVLLLISSPISSWLGSRRVALGMTSSKEKAGVDPTTFVGTFVLAGFRPLAINYLWIKATGLQQQKNHWELRATYELLSKLQPTNPDVWVFNAWNMSYNISVEMADPEDAWRWIIAGQEFIQRGRETLPDAEMIHAFESQLFYQKIYDQLPEMRARVEAKYGRSALELALEANGRAFRKPDHHPQICLARRAILIRMAQDALFERADLDGARAIYREVDVLSKHIMRHPQVKMYIWPVELPGELLEAAGKGEFTTFAGRRDALRDALKRGQQDARWNQRWEEVRGILSRVARCYRVLGKVMEDRRGPQQQQLRNALVESDNGMARLWLAALLHASERYFDEWAAFCKVQEQATRARHDIQQMVKKMFQLPLLERKPYSLKVKRVFRERFGQPLMEAARKLRQPTLRAMLVQRARSIPY